MNSLAIASLVSFMAVHECLSGISAAWILPARHVLPRVANVTLGDGDSPLIINGNPVSDRTKYPHLARIISTASGGTRSQCTGSLISSNYVLTAGHCLVDDSRGGIQKWFKRTLDASWSVTLGDLDDSIIEGTEQVIAGQGIPYTKYPIKIGAADPTDIGLIKLNQPATLNQYVNTIPLPTSSFSVSDGSVAEAAGWGYSALSAGGTPTRSSQLRTGQLKVYTPGGSVTCGSYFKKKHICLLPASTTTQQLICSGDSGGPITQDVQGRRVLVGVTSYVDTSCASYGGAVAVAAYLDWINSYL